MNDAKALVLAVEADKTIMLDREEMLENAPSVRYRDSWSTRVTRAWPSLRCTVFRR